MPSTDAPQRILIIRPSALGDVCRSVPVLASLKRRWPDARVDWLVQDTFAPAIENHPDLGRAVLFPRARFGKWYSPATGAAVLAWLSALRRERYDLVIDCQGLARSGFFAWATGARRRIGYANAEELGWLGLTERIAVPRGSHTVDRMLRLAGAATGESGRAEPDMRLSVADSEREAVAGDPRLRGKRFAVIAPTSRWAGKLWPAARFAEVAHWIMGDGSEGSARVEAVVVVGAASERSQCGPLLELAARDTRVVDLVGQTSIARLMAVIEASSLVVGNDSASLHMAVGFNRPLVGLFGPTDVSRVGPYGRGHQVVRVLRPGDKLDHKDERNGREMMERITVGMVIDKVAEVVRAWEGGVAARPHRPLEQPVGSAQGTD